MLRKILGGAAIALLLFIAAGIYLLTRQTVPPPKPVTPSEVANAQERLSAALNPIPGSQIPETNSGGANSQSPNTTKPISDNQVVRISESDVNTVLAGSNQVITDLAAQGISKAQVTFLPPSHVVVSGIIARNDATQSITVDGTLVAIGDGSLAYRPKGVRLGDLPVPESTFDKLIRHESDRILQAGLPHLPIVVEEVSVKNHQLLLVGSPRPN